VFTPNKKITGSIRVDQEILKTLKKISVADAKKELARYGVTCFDKLRDVYHNSSHLGHITHDTSLDNDNMDYIYGSLLSYRRYYNPKKTLTDDERKSISQELYLGNYLIVLYDKIRYLYESQRELESTRKSAYHLLDDAGIEDLLQRRWTPSLRYDGDVWDYNSKKDTKDLRD
jgi:hypothetical protein